MLQRFIQNESAATSIEYGAIAFLLSITVVTGAKLIGGNLFSNYFSPLAVALK